MKPRSLTDLAVSSVVAILGAVGWVYTTWISPLSMNQYQDHATLSAAVANVRNITSSLNDIQSRVDWLSEQKGYQQADTTTNLNGDLKL